MFVLARNNRLPLRIFFIDFDEGWYEVLLRIRKESYVPYIINSFQFQVVDRINIINKVKLYEMISHFDSLNGRQFHSLQFCTSVNCRCVKLLANSNLRFFNYLHKSLTKLKILTDLNSNLAVPHYQKNIYQCKLKKFI